MVKIIFKWYDLWIGFFYDRKKRMLYFLPVPMVGIIIPTHKHVWREKYARARKDTTVIMQCACCQWEKTIPIE